MRAQIARVVAGAVDQGRLAAPQELHPHEVDAGRADDAAVMRDVALAVEDWQLQPGIIRPVAGGPNDRLGRWLSAGLFLAAAPRSRPKRHGQS